MIKNFLKKITGRSKDKESSQFCINNFSYDTVKPFANYAPWLMDSEFMEVYGSIKNNTLVDIFRCYELWELTEKIHNLDKSVNFIEVGVWRGGTAGIIGKKLGLLKSDRHFYLADTFTGVVKISEKDTFYKGGEHSDTSQAIVENLLINYYDNCKVLKGIFPDDTSHLIDINEKFGLCHIDVDVYESAKAIVSWIWNRMIIGGIIIFDDYGFHTCDGITKYVNEQKLKPDRLILHNLNGHAIMVKLA
jgi:O-methyltransferase